MDLTMMDLAKNSTEKNKRKRMRRKLRKRVNDKDGLEIADPTNTCLEISNDRKSAEMVTLLDINSTAQSLPGKESKVDTVSAEIFVEKSATEQAKVDKVSTEVLVEKRASSKRKRKKSRRMANVEDKLENVDPTNKCLEIARNDKVSLIANILDVNSVPQSMSQEKSEVDTVSTETRTMEKPKVDTVSSESPSEKSASSIRKRRKLRRRTANIKDEVEIADPTDKCSKISSNGKSCVTAVMDTNLEIHSTAHSQSQGQPEVDTVSTEICTTEQPIGDTVSTDIPVQKRALSRSMRSNLNRKAKKKREQNIVDLTKKCLEISNNKKSCNVAEMGAILDVNSTPQSLSQGQREVDTNLEIHSTAHSQSQGKPNVDTVSSEICTIEQPIGDTVSTEIPVEKRTLSRSTRRKLNRKAKKKREQNIVDLTKKCLEISNNEKSCNIAEMGTILDINSTSKSLSQGQNKVDTVSTEIRTIEQPTVDTISTEILVEERAMSKRMRKKLNRMAKNKSELDIMDPTNNCLEISTNGQSCLIAEMDTNLSINSTAQSLSQKQLEADTVPTQIVVQNSANRKKKKRKGNVKKKVQTADGFSSMDQGDSFSKDSCQLPKSSPFTRSRRILLILDLNGLLADIVMPPPKGHKSDINIYSRAIFKRPHYYDFLRFCFETFDVGIWSSRSKKIIVRVVDYLLGNLKHKLLFCWDMFHCTHTEFKTLDNKHKPLVCKELRKLWDKPDPNLPWNKGDYDETNTLLIDDSPYKALLNPMCTAIFPRSYTFKDQNDNALGPGGDLRVYLQNLAKAESVQKYVEQHPFGQSAISDKHASWGYYSRVLQSLSHPKPIQPPPQPNNVILNVPHSNSLGIQLPQVTNAMDET